MLETYIKSPNFHIVILCTLAQNIRINLCMGCCKEVMVSMSCACLSFSSHIGVTIISTEPRTN